MKKNVLITIVVILLLQFPVRVLIADVLWKGALYLLDDPKTEYADTSLIDDATFPKHLRAETMLKAASALVPSQPLYPRAIGDLLMIRGRWAAVMEEMQVPLPEGARSSKEDFQRAGEQYQEALRRDPVDDRTHLALGVLYDQTDAAGLQAETAYDRATALSPRSVQVRYAVALQHLRAGRNGEALEHASALARIDASGAYLTRAFEIAWTASGGDVEVLKGMAMEAKNGEKMLTKFLASKGIKEPT
jgi:tetratricopeptide (TPR) repeat protein